MDQLQQLLQNEPKIKTIIIDCQNDWFDLNEVALKQKITLIVTNSIVYNGEQCTANNLVVINSEIKRDQYVLSVPDGCNCVIVIKKSEHLKNQQVYNQKSFANRLLVVKDGLFDTFVENKAADESFLKCVAHFVKKNGIEGFRKLNQQQLEQLFLQNSPFPHRYQIVNVNQKLDLKVYLNWNNKQLTAFIINGFTPQQQFLKAINSQTENFGFIFLNMSRINEICEFINNAQFVVLINCHCVDKKLFVKQQHFAYIQCTDQSYVAMSQTEPLPTVIKPCIQYLLAAIIIKFGWDFFRFMIQKRKAFEILNELSSTQEISSYIYKNSLEKSDISNLECVPSQLVSLFGLEQLFCYSSLAFECNELINQFNQYKRILDQSDIKQIQKQISMEVGNDTFILANANLLSKYKSKKTQLLILSCSCQNVVQSYASISEATTQIDFKYQVNKNLVQLIANIIRQIGFQKFVKLCAQKQFLQCLYEGSQCDCIDCQPLVFNKVIKEFQPKAAPLKVLLQIFTRESVVVGLQKRKSYLHQMEIQNFQCINVEHLHKAQKLIDVQLYKEDSLSFQRSILQLCKQKVAEGNDQLMKIKLQNVKKKQKLGLLKNSYSLIVSMIEDMFE